MQEPDYDAIQEASARSGIPRVTLLRRLDDGLSLDEAVERGISNQTGIVVDGLEFSSIASAATHFGVSDKAARWRLSNGWTAQEAFSLVKRKRPPVAERKGREVVVKGRVFPTATSAALFYEVKPQLFVNRLRKGLTAEQALELEPFPEWFIPGQGQFARARRAKREEQQQATGLKKCSLCKKEKPLEQFHVGKKGGRASRCSECVSGAFLRYRYGITVEHFNWLRLKQHGKCAICEQVLQIEEQSVRREKTVAVDHCHATGAVRGLLCSSCNTGLGMFKDSVSLLGSAIRYLNQSTL